MYPQQLEYIVYEVRYESNFKEISFDTPYIHLWDEQHFQKAIRALEAAGIQDSLESNVMCIIKPKDRTEILLDDAFRDDELSQLKSSYTLLKNLY